VRGVDAQTEKWVRFPVYGGSLFNNVVQGAACDLLVNGMQKAEAAGYPIVLHTHDEMAAEVPRGFGDVGEFERLICELPDWAAGLPLTASGWRGKRYRKD
jgi:DNA polymerase